MIKSFVGLRAKSYSLTLSGEQDGREERKLAAVGVKSCIAKKYLSHQDFLDCVKQVQGKESRSVIQTSIRAYKHKLFVNQQSKVGLSAIDDKRFVCEDGFSTRAHGHWKNDFEF